MAQKEVWLRQEWADKEGGEQTPETKLGRKAERVQMCFKGAESTPAAALAFSHNELLSGKENKAGRSAQLLLGASAGYQQ